LLKYAAGSSRSQVQLAYWFALIFLFVFSAFRFEVGCDWTGYLNQYYVYGAVPLAALAQQAEPLWVGLFSLQTLWNLDYPWINVASSVIFFAGAHVMAQRQPNPLAFLVLLFPVLIINMPMSGIRQGAAIGVMFIAFMAFVDRALVRFVVLVFVAAAFHSSAMVFMLLAPLVTGKYSRGRLFLAAVLALPGAFFLSGSEEAGVAASRYINSGADAAGALFRVGVLGLSGLYFLWFLRRKWERDFPADFKLAMIGSLMMVGALILVPVSSVIADRLAYYLIPVQVLILTRIPYFQWRSSHQLHTVFPYALLLSMFVVWTSLSSLFDQCYRPYQTWIFGYPEMVHASF
jgi:hypothetical protein